MCYAFVVSVREALRRIVSEEPRVQFALLFGSRVRAVERPDSDWDIAVYLDDATTPAERLRARAHLAARLAEVAPADVVVLNDADPLLAAEALSGEVLIVSDRRDYVRYYVRAMGLAEDQRYFDAIIAEARARRLAEGRFGRP